MLRQAGLRDGGDAPEIAEKTAVTDELAGRDLMDPSNPVRVIITKQALQEGWDCPFAYVLCCLAANRNRAALTQLVGRILRQPGAKRTRVASLDRCYVVTHRAETAEVAKAIRDGLERDGMGDLTDALRERAPGGTVGPRMLPRRPAYRDPIYLPQIVWNGEGGPRPLDYDADVLAPLDFRGVDLTARIAAFPLDGSHIARTGRVAIGLDAEGHALVGAETAVSGVAAHFDVVVATRALADLVPNAFVAHRLVTGFRDGLLARGATPDLLGRLSGFLQAELRDWLRAAGDALAEARFRTLLADGTIECRLRADGLDWRMPDEIATAHADGARTLRHPDDCPLARDLFTPTYEADFNDEERKVALFLDDRATLDWWHRSVARAAGGYAIQGWRRQRIWPDFLFRHRPDGEAEIVAMETKGTHLSGNDDTAYKKAVMEAVTAAYRRGGANRIGELTVGGGEAGFRCEMVMLDVWRTELPKLTPAA
ncbi:hypothetical protein ACE7GA_26835 (plasmid) [Roseomonas sp. CCTCC AB2023176]|uniref:hypothetical protein n=1 Tax=Roseomonas sp. CCTCC AB2023176 TaxID=3342640 RepID=UPI0035D8B885